ncbi:hypothetical protein [Sulfitobacter faviae]|nr:hypothetical protein [Sulfitobacter faviae]
MRYRSLFDSHAMASGVLPVNTPGAQPHDNAEAKGFIAEGLFGDI